jgi:hypothetical protein
VPLTTTTVLTDRFDRALLYATHVHGGQVRKGTSTPYVAHLLAVAATALEYGGDEDLAIAALLHDSVEDQGGKARLDDIWNRFGEGVARSFDLAIAVIGAEPLIEDFNDLDHASIHSESPRHGQTVGFAAVDLNAHAFA